MDAPWGLQQLSSRSRHPVGRDINALDYTYLFDEPAGQGVDIFQWAHPINTYSQWH